MKIWIFFLVAFIILILILISVLVFFFIKRKNSKTKDNFANLVNDLLEKKDFWIQELVFLSKNMAVAVNKKNTTMLVITKNHSSDECLCEEIRYLSVNSIEKNKNTITVNYSSNSESKFLQLNKTKQIESLVYNFYKNASVTKLSRKFNIKNFIVTSGSDWNCSYVWAYSDINNIFAYYRNIEDEASYKLRILKEFFTLDTKFSYFQAPIMGINQQLFVYEKDFLDELYKYLIYAIKQRTVTILQDKIYYDAANEIVYLSDGVHSLQSVIIDKTEEVYYLENKLSFSIKEEENIINYIADDKLIIEFENFVTTYNLRKIASSFNYSLDKLINATDSTKFIVDYTRDRVVYCANLNKFSSFSYIAIAFNNLSEVKLEKSGNNYFVRINTKNKETIDISCKKQQIAQYIMAEITTIINN